MHRAGGQRPFLMYNSMVASKERSNEHYSQTTDDKMLKFLKEVKLVIIFPPVHFKIAKKKDLAKNLEKRPHTQF